MSKRPAAGTYSDESLAAAWRVSTRAVRDAAAIRGIVFLGRYLVVPASIVRPRGPFCKEARFIELSLRRAAARRAAADGQ